MLIEYKVTNYRSIKAPQILSLVATKDNSLKDTNCMASGIPAIPQLLRSAVLYGPNASGKSNVISSLESMRTLIVSPIVEGQALPIVPFRLDPETSAQPSEFEITFMDNNIRYQYGYSVDSQRILGEWLFVYIGRKAQCWFEREYDKKTQKDKWHLGTHLVGGMQRKLWAESTRTNALFLSTAVNLNSEQLRPIFNWFLNKLVIVGGNSQPLPFYTMECVKDKNKKPQIIQFLQAADLGITDVEIKTQKGQQLQMRLESGKTTFNGQTVDIPMAELFHQGKNNIPIGFQLSDESSGARRIFAYAGPMLDVLKDGKVLVIDELDSGLHVKMVRFLINLIQNTDLNKNNAQLIFTTHNTSILDIELLRRDQIWFIEKDTDQASNLYSLTNFSPRKEEALEKGYLQGRYGALPIFSDLNL
ncbi:MAG TPA: ATP-binding protein [Gammaproteobacteria bacterium]|nr:ATP-binding protein [Gammaproteobacteria bacterium]